MSAEQLSDLPRIEVDVEGVWRPGRLLHWDPRDDGLWASVAYEARDRQTHEAAFPAERVRPPSPVGLRAR